MKQEDPTEILPDHSEHGIAGCVGATIEHLMDCDWCRIIFSLVLKEMS